MIDDKRLAEIEEWARPTWRAREGTDAIRELVAEVRLLREANAKLLKAVENLQEQLDGGDGRA